MLRPDVRRPVRRPDLCGPLVLRSGCPELRRPGRELLRNEQWLQQRLQQRLRQAEVLQAEVPQAEVLQGSRPGDEVQEAEVLQEQVPEEPLWERLWHGLRWLRPELRRPVLCGSELRRPRGLLRLIAMFSVEEGQVGQLT